MPTVLRVMAVQLGLGAAVAVIWMLSHGLEAGGRGALGALYGAILTGFSGVAYLRRMAASPSAPLGALFGSHLLKWLGAVAGLVIALRAWGAEALPFVTGLAVAALGFWVALLFKD